MSAGFGPIALLLMGMACVLFMAKVAREGGRDPMIWGLFSMLVMVGSVVLFILAGPLMRSRGTPILMAWMFGGIVIQFAAQGALYFVLHSLEGKASTFVEARLPVFLVDQPETQLEVCELAFEKEGLEIHDSATEKPLTIAYGDIQAAEPDGEVVRIHWQVDSSDPEQLSVMIADEELSPRARRAQGISIAAKLARLSGRAP